MAKSKSCNGGALVDGGMIDAGIGLGVGYGVSWVLQKLMFANQNKALVGSAQGGVGAGMAFMGAQVGFPVVGIAAGAAAAAKGLDNVITMLAEAHKANAAPKAAGALAGPSDSQITVRDAEGREYLYVKGSTTETLVLKSSGDTVAVNNRDQRVFEVGSDGIVRPVNAAQAALSGPDEDYPGQIAPVETVGVVL